MTETAGARQDAKRVMVLGIDGGSEAVIRRLAGNGTMPFMQSVLERGRFGPLTSVYPPATPPAWSTFMTGKNPGKHGIYEFSTYEGYDREPRVVNATRVQSETLWSMLTRAGKSLVAVNVPMTYPPAPVNGYVMGGLFSPSTEAAFTYPKSLYEQLRPQLGDYTISVNWQRYARRQFGRFMADLTRCTEQRTRYFQHLLRQADWDFSMIVFSETDFLQHIAWTYLDPDDDRDRNPAAEGLVTRYFRLLDDKLRLLAEEAGDAALVVFASDHGFGPLYKWVSINTWLAEQGLLTFRPEPVKKVRRALRLKRLVARCDPLNLRKLLPRGKGERMEVFGLIDWDRTQAFAALAGEQGIRINLKGREPQGIVAPGAAYDALCDELVEKLKQLRDPATNETIGAFVARREEVYSGPMLERACDVLYFLADGRYLTDVLPREAVFEATSWHAGSGTHRLQGLLGAIGPGVGVGTGPSDAMLQDLCPTILTVLGVPIPDDVDGRFLDGLFEPSAAAGYQPRFARAGAGPAQSTDGYTEEDEKHVVERLRALGYID